MPNTKYHAKYQKFKFRILSCQISNIMPITKSLSLRSYDAKYQKLKFQVLLCQIPYKISNMLSNMPNTWPTSRCHCPKLLHGRTNNQGQLAKILKNYVF